MTTQPTAEDEDLGRIDAHAGALGQADLIFVFGTRHWTPAEIAVQCYRDGLAPVVVLTGGGTRQHDGLNEARQHRSLLIAAGVPEEAIVVEDRSTVTHENVALAAAALKQILPRPAQAVAVVKWYHRRGLVELAQHMPSLQRIFAADYEPHNPVKREVLSRTAWRTTCPRSVARELGYMEQIIQSGRDPLTRTEAGWIRSKA